MKRFEELKKEEKKMLKKEFRKTSFGRYAITSSILVNLTGLLCLGSIVKLALLWLVILVVLDEVLYYLHKKMIREYYELKGNK